MPPQITLTNDHNVGQHLSATMRTRSGQLIPLEDLGHVMKITAKGKSKKRSFTPISRGGKTITRNIPQGWDGEVQFVRMNGNLTDMFATIEQNFYDSGEDFVFDLACAVINPDGSTNQYLFGECSLNDPDFGDWEGNKEVEQGFGFMASYLKKVS